MKKGRLDLLKPSSVAWLFVAFVAVLGPALPVWAAGRRPLSRPGELVKIVPTPNSPAIPRLPVIPLLQKIKQVIRENPDALGREPDIDNLDQYGNFQITNRVRSETGGSANLAVSVGEEMLSGAIVAAASLNNDFINATISLSGPDGLRTMMVKFQLNEDGDLQVVTRLLEFSTRTQVANELFEESEGTWDFGPDGPRLSSPDPNFASSFASSGSVVADGGACPVASCSTTVLVVVVVIVVASVLCWMFCWILYYLDATPIYHFLEKFWLPRLSPERVPVALC